MLYRKIIAVCSEIYTKPKNTLCGQNVGSVGPIVSEIKKYYIGSKRIEVCYIQ
jgi:hypothetical protein